ncbi:MAG TPA: DUF6351 family protein [Telluria sp.]
MNHRTSWKPGALAAITLAAITLAAIALAGCTGIPPAPQPGLTLRVLSSEPDYVSGGDARVEVAAPAGLEGRLAFRLNGRRIDPPMAAAGKRSEGIVTGLVNGRNVLEATLTDARGRVSSDALVLTNHPVTGPMFSGPQQQPFICRSEESGLGQPLVDNQEGIGHPVFEEGGKRLLGYSRYCGIKTQVHYFYYTGEGFKPFDPASGYAAPPADLKTIAIEGASLPFVVRVEGGSINRFLYTIAMLAPFPQAPGAAPLDGVHWNRKLLYWMRGGAGVGHQQGTAMWFNNGLWSAERELMPTLLRQGYAVATTSGNESGVQLNIRLSEETAMMTKEHFIETYGVPRHTIGIGASGGALQQYLPAQNRPGLLDAGIPIQSYPDMITQAIPVSDCPLLEQYFADEVALDPASPWKLWSRRSLIEGMNASDTVINPITGKPGSTECINGWQELVPTVINPAYKDPEYDQAARRYGYRPDVFANVKWTHWNDLANIYGTDARGFAPTTIDNVGVQYGLGALARGQIGKDEFLRINACVGGWKSQSAFVPWDRAADPFDARNMQRSATCRDPHGQPAARHEGDVQAMRAAYVSGHVFTGRRLAFPAIDLRPYLEPVLDMHNARQSFSIRARLLDANPAAARNQVIWFNAPQVPMTGLVNEALAVLEDYLAAGVAPAAFTDRCVDAGGATIAAGPHAWAGVLDGRPPGPCTRAFPIYSSPRMEAGESIKGAIFKCTTKALALAFSDGTYPRSVQFTPAEKAWLERIFPQGVCDYRLPDQGRPAGL